MRLSTQNLIAIIGFTIMAAIAVVAAFPSKFQLPLAILTGNATAVATLDDEYLQRTSKRTGTTYNVHYAFTVNGTEYRGSSGIGEVPTKTMTVTYLVGSPTINGLELTTHAWIDLVIFCVPLGVLVACLGVIWRHWRGAAQPTQPTTSRGRISY
jgi:ABC-type dipeptide/oligopeptide/nickel transport system permease component